ncbi:MAG: hypothetical protein JWN62_4702 [Acidimicrobiales bacterium]|nr:hypothetical protein [Acidimicrobiales bacterium]
MSSNAEKLGVKPPRGETPRTCDIAFAEYVSSFKQCQYTQGWIDRLVALCSHELSFAETTGRPARPFVAGESPATDE